MCSEILGFSPFLRMYESDNPKSTLKEDEDQQERIIVPENPTRPLTGNPDSGQEKTRENLETIEVKAEDEVTENVLENGVDDDDDGFRTPTSSDHKIPAVTRCPPAPRKTRPQQSGVKRKASPSRARRSLQFDAAADEVESIFRTVVEDSVEEQNIKKARRDDAD